MSFHGCDSPMQHLVLKFTHVVSFSFNVSSICKFGKKKLHVFISLGSSWFSGYKFQPSLGGFKFKPLGSLFTNRSFSYMSLSMIINLGVIMFTFPIGIRVRVADTPQNNLLIAFQALSF